MHTNYSEYAAYPKIRPTGENGALYMDPQSAINDSDYTNSQDSGYCMIGPGSRRNQQMDNDNYAVPNIEVHNVISHS